MTETPNPHLIDTDALTGEMHPIRRVVVSLGSNLGERRAALQGAVNALADTPDVWLTDVSGVYETEPVDSPEGSGKYLNAIVLLDTTLPARRLLERAMTIESAFERERSDVRNAPRTLDVDLIQIGERRSNDEEMQLPHPRAHLRPFVLQPWLDLDAEAVLLDSGPVVELLADLDSTGIVKREDIVLELP